VKSSEDTLREILALAALHFGVARDALGPDDDLFDALGIDSLKALELLTRLERHFRIELPDWEMQDVTDFRTLAERIHARIG
jgi:acyl carrier protein